MRKTEAAKLTERRSGAFGAGEELAGIARGQRPVRFRFADGHDGWLIADYAQVRAVLADKRFIVSVPRTPFGNAAKFDAGREVTGSLESGFVSGFDPPEHTRLRRIVGEWFTPGGVSRLQGRIERIISGKLESMVAGTPPADLFSEFARPIPASAICELLGVPHADAWRFIKPTELAMSATASPAELSSAQSEFADYVRAVARQKREAPSDDLVSFLATCGKMSDDEIAGMAMELFVTGHETTAGLISLGAVALLQEGAAGWKKLCQEPALLDQAVEEILRFVNVAEIAFPRTALEDVEIGETVIAAGESVILSLVAANQDPSFVDAPEHLDLERPQNRHLAFGHGIHKCLGQHLARLELKLALEALAQRLPTLRLAVPITELRMEATDLGVYRVKELPVSW